MGAGRGQNPPANQVTGAQGADGGDDERMGGLRTLLPPRPQWGTAADDGSAGTPTRHTAGTDSARPEHGALASRKYNLLAPTGPAINPADVG